MTKPYRSQSARMCSWHRYGKPAGTPDKFFLATCPKCQEKLAKGLVSATDPPPKVHYLKSMRRLRYGKEQYKPYRPPVVA